MSRTKHYLDCNCSSCVNELIDDIASLQAENEKLKKEVGNLKGAIEKLSHVAMQEAAGIVAENEKLKAAIEGALRIKDLWFFQSDSEEHLQESMALATMRYDFEQALKD